MNWSAMDLLLRSSLCEKECAGFVQKSFFCISLIFVSLSISPKDWMSVLHGKACM